MFYNMKKDNKIDLSKSKCNDNRDFSEDRMCGNLYNRTHQDIQFIKEKDKEKKISEEKYNDVQKDIEQQKTDISQPKYNELLKNYQESITKIDDIILKKYISRLSELPIIPFENEIKDDIFNNEKEPNHEEVKDEKEKKTEKIFNLSNLNKIRIFKIDKMIYEKDEFALHKFATVFNVFSAIQTALFVIIDSDGVNTEFYMGIRCDSDDNEDDTTTSIGDMLNSAMIGQFCGIDIKPIEVEEDSILKKIDDRKFCSISSVSCVSDIRDENLNENTKFVQGLEKLVISMQGKKYTGIILANTATQEKLNLLRNNYEQIYTQLSAFASKQLNYGFNFSIGEGKSNTISVANNYLNQLGITCTKGNTHSVSTSEKDPTSKTINAAAYFVERIPVASLLTGFLRGLSSLSEKTTTIQDSNSESTALNMQHSDSKTIDESDTKENSLSQGMNNSIILNFKDKTIENILLRIEKQLKRIDEFESLGMFECAGYFLSEDRSTSKIVASTYKSIVCGKKSGIETSAVNTWYNNKDDYEQIIKYVKNFTHPVFKYSDDINIKVTPCSMVSGNELAILMGLPRKSVFGFPVLEHADFGKQVVTYDLDFDSEESKPDSEADSKKNEIELGCIFNMGKKYEDNKICIDKESLSMHTFITGTTGSGKSNTIYELINQLSEKDVKFMVIEPAKGEYKEIFRNRGEEVKVFGTNPEISDILTINPFKFPKGIHIFEHIDRLVEIFNVCWPMYGAMSAFLKEAILESYKIKGFDLSSSQDLYSQNNIDNNDFPTFKDLNEALDKAIKESAYSQEVKGNYIGSLVTRVKSLTNGINGQIFTSEEIDNKILFDENVIIDLSRIPSLETKSLIMGILIMRLSEHRMVNSKAMNKPLEHITILEEAHHILKRTSKEQNPENPSISGKSVEMISNAIAEMRTYGEGFVIADQSPNEVDLSAIRNTNTKIIMRLPDELDRRLAGKSAGLKEEQLDEIVKLPKGVAVVYQNNWVEPVLCKINKYKI